MEYVTFNLYFWSMGAIVSVVSAVVGYWIKEVKGIGRAFDQHRERDEREFANYRLEVLKMHQSMERHFSDKNNNLEKSIVQIHEHLQYVKQSIDEIKQKI